jgi:hypothetical protein
MNTLKNLLSAAGAVLLLIALWIGTFGVWVYGWITDAMHENVVWAIAGVAIPLIGWFRGVLHLLGG